MSLKTTLLKPIAKLIARKVNKMAKNAVADQDRIMKDMVSRAANTLFGKDHHFSEIHSYEDFKKNVPIRDYEGLRSYIELVIEGKNDVLWPGKPKYFAKTSGTTSGVKYIPITKEGMPNHINTARNAVMCYIAETGNAQVLGGKVMFLSGSPILSEKGGIPTGRLSGIVNHEVPKWLQSSQMPSYETNCIEDWERKVEKVVGETMQEDMRLIGGIPPWVQMYYEKILEVSGKKNVRAVFPNFELFVYGGVNYEPYRAKLEELVGKKIDSVEYYPASEGFIAFQISQKDNGLLLNTDSGIFYEFIPIDEYFDENPTRLKLSDVKMGVDYALIINNNSGLWGYSIGDCVRFISLDPYKLVVSGRVKHYISAFGEHVIGKEVEEAMNKIAHKHGIQVVEFTVAPQVNPPEGGLPYHEWFIEADGNVIIDTIAEELDEEMCVQNIYYKDLIDGKILRTLKVRKLGQGAFRRYMKENGKLGGQNKVPRLTNDRKIADRLLSYIED